MDSELAVVGAKSRPTLTLTQRRAIEEVNFLRRHPEITGYVGTLMSTVVACEESGISVSDIRLDEAYEHVFGRTATTACPWCSRTFETKKEMQEDYYEATSK